MVGRCRKTSAGEIQRRKTRDIDGPPGTEDEREMTTVAINCVKYLKLRTKTLL